MRTGLAVATAVMMVVVLSGCVSLKIGTETGPSLLKMEGLANGYVTLSALHRYNGTIVDFGLFTETQRRGEILSLDVWPVAGVGVGVVGARVRVLPLELGLGALWYNPKPQPAETEKQAEKHAGKGSGNIVSEARAAAGFTRVSSAGGVEVVLTQGEQESVTVEADDDVVPMVKTEVEDGKLCIRLDEPLFRRIRPTQTIKVNVTMPKIEGITLSGSGAAKAAQLAAEKLEIVTSGSGNVAIDALDAGELDVRITGSGKVTCAGKVNRQTARLTGSGDYRAAKLESQSAAITTSGSGDATIWAVESLDAQITGSGNIRYAGQPRTTQKVTGSGRLMSVGQP